MNFRLVLLGSQELPLDHGNVEVTTTLPACKAMAPDERYGALMPSQSRHGYGIEFHHKLQTQPSHTTQYAYCQQQCRTKVELRSKQGRIILTHRCPCTHANNDSNTANLQTTSLRSDGHFVCEHVPSLAEPSERRCTSCPQCNRLPPLVTLHIVHVPICDRRPAPAEVMPSGTIERHETHHLHSRGGTWLSDAEGPLSHDVAHRRCRVACWPGHP
jgi:hypothetical protein